MSYWGHAQKYVSINNEPPPPGLDEGQEPIHDLIANAGNEEVLGPPGEDDINTPSLQLAKPTIRLPNHALQSFPLHRSLKGNKNEFNR